MKTYRNSLFMFYSAYGCHYAQFRQESAKGKTVSKRLIRIIILVLVLLALASGVQSQKDLPPYIYYYDSLHGGLVIERADGRDSRIINDILPGSPWYGFSATGRYFALGRYHSIREGLDDEQQVQVISTDGQQRLQIRQYRLSETRVSWAPDADMVLIFGADRDGQIQAQLIDVDSAHVLANAAFGVGYDADYAAEVYWENEFVNIFWGHTHLVTLHHDGLIELKNYPRVEQYQIYPDYYERRLLYPNRHLTGETITIVLQDLQSKQRIEIEDRLGRLPYPYHIRWSPTLRHALISAHPCEGDSCEGWLKLIDWESGDITTVTPTVQVPDRGRECGLVHTCAELWSPQGNYAIFANHADVVYLLDVSTASTHEIASHGTVRYYRWNPADEQLFIAYDGDSHLYKYDPATGREEQFELPQGMHSVFPSPEGHYVGLSTSRPTILNENGDIIEQSIPHSHSTASYEFPWEYVWHHDEQWVIANYVIAFAGGGYGPVASLLFNLDGTVRRELPTGGESGFVPDRAIPYLPPGQPTSLKKDPIFTLPQAGRIYGVGWHPTDPNQLVTYSEEEGIVFWLLAADKPEITDQIIPAAPFPSQFPVGLKLFWLPEQDLVAFYEDGDLHYMDAATGNILPVEGVEYPLFTPTDAGASIHYSLSDDVLRLDTEGIALGRPFALTSNRIAFIIAGDQGSDNLYYINAYTGEMTRLRVPAGTYYTVDASSDVAALGSVYNCCILMVNTDTGNVVDEFYGTALSLALSFDGRRLATTSREMIAIWDVSEDVSEE
ncbi:MAG: hypothetical protein K8J31_31720 [Anaerolineae bacterium]|nr:hypothetical protein [Anaerolineae bacterium]